MSKLVALNGDVILAVSITYSTEELGLDFYEATRKHWHVEGDIERITHVVGVQNSKVVVVYDDMKWTKTPKGYEFTSPNQNGDLTSPYLGQEIRMYGPTQYV